MKIMVTRARIYTCSLKFPIDIKWQEVIQGDLDKKRSWAESSNKGGRRETT